ncbi:metal ABC transporter substrate-binding protein [Shimwellia pseudoproteus]|uniref:metal ABC transporter substrate-binding protein n=1 Tax=Shimwellia pseudoproteus TaxID=570012 RepID=UPI0018ED0C93|nr:metal ABC transporter substrate-binding protein [Shimwellia pseudoproteus]MBJ3816879.1 metal ABC transporter substrate-binding protein [Shimwellia pseudoproteus]
MKLFASLAIFLLAAVSAAANAAPLQVVASFTITADMAKQIGGDHVVVHSLVGPNGDPHTFEPTPQDSQLLNQADLVITSGLGLEGWLTRLISASGYKHAIVVASQGVTTRSMEEDGKTITDPHAWNSAHNGAIYARNIMQALISADPQHASDFRQRGTAYIAQLEKLDSWAKTTFAALPKNRRLVLTSHDAFGYFGKAYGVTFLAPVGFSTEAQPSASDVASLINQLKRHHSRYYFVENQTDPRLVKQIAAATGAQPGGTLYPEALSDASGPAPTYQAAFRHNVQLIAASMK